MIKIHVRVIFFFLFISCSFNVAYCQNDSKQEDWVSLFNGKNLEGWNIKIAGQKLNDNYKNTFRVEDSMLRIVYDDYKTFDDKYGHLYYKKPYSYYILRYQYRFRGDQTPGGETWNVRNSGVMIHSQSAKSLTINQNFPVSLEVQLLGGLGKGERHTGNLCTPGTQVHVDGKISEAHCIDSKSKTYDGDQWVSMTVVVLGDSVIKHIVEGDTVLTYEKPEVGGGFVGKDADWKWGHVDNYQYWESRQNTPLKEGYIALQAESHPIDFRRIEILNLEGCTDRKAKNYKDYYIKSDNRKCLY
ncbi:3-keto-disaccharide hydrolase [Segetibacter koreensis]|uniref:3-keto-disaccharide hydrolase n=1 Tax=Segetibacter koreensis TaxID=398037 RepID=UPI00037313B3|nr:DUF1080 domain-containing protein [Segetibacter koreensis]